MEIKDLVVYDWSSFSPNPLSDYEIKKLLKQDLFRLHYETIHDKLKVPSSGISNILFVCDGILELTYNDVVYNVKPSQFIQIPRGHHVFKCSENFVYYKAMLARDLPTKGVDEERRKIPEVQCKTLITHSMNWWGKNKQTIANLAKTAYCLII